MTHVYNESSVLQRRMSELKVDPARAVKERKRIFFFFFSLRILKKQDSEAQKDFFFFLKKTFHGQVYSLAHLLNCFVTVLQS